MNLDWLELDSKHIGVILEDDSEDNFDIKVEKIDKFDYTPKWNNAASKLVRQILICMHRKSVYLKTFACRCF